MEADVITLGTITIRRRPEERFEGFTTSKKKSIGKVIPFHITDEKINIELVYAIFINGERDIRARKLDIEHETFERLKQGLRLTILPVPSDPHSLYIELRQAYSSNTNIKHETLHPTFNEVDLDEGANLSVFDELRKVGATVGSKQELIDHPGRTSRHLCARFAKDNLWVPIVAYTTTRILPLLLGYTGTTIW